MKKMIKKKKIKKSNLSNVFGTLKTKISGQEFKDMCREGW